LSTIKQTINSKTSVKTQNKDKTTNPNTAIYTSGETWLPQGHT
jgi:hypothetical protein